MSEFDVRWQQRFANDQRALEQLESFFDLLRSEGNSELIGSRDTLREAFRVGLVVDGNAWMQMIQDRTLTSHSYNPATDDLRAHVDRVGLLLLERVPSPHEIFPR